MTHRIDLSIGPVQGFIARSRRTRDLWGSSYLLAFLTARAMRGVEEAGGKIVQPLVDGDQLYRWVKGERNGKAPSTGSLPNHFVAEVTSGDPGVVARAGVDAMQDAWGRVCDTVWDRFVADIVAHGNGTTDIWRRQVEHFWEVTWTVGPTQGSDDSHRGSNGLRPLARRKRWRSHCLPQEDGDKCTVMPDFQELSGFVRAAGREERGRQDDFWEDLRKRAGGSINLRDNERLCAIAFVKRMFVGVGEEALGWEVDAGSWPSTVNVAAVPWMREVARRAPEAAAKYAEVAKEASPNSLGPPWPFKRMEEQDRLGAFPRLDANWLHEASLRNESMCPLEGDDADEVRSTLLKALRALHKSAVTSASLGPPPRFYALLLADGDRLGELLRELGTSGRGIVSRALAEFTGRVSSLVHRHDGMAVYAGGDDVLAMLPAESALACAVALSESYRQAFPSHSGSGAPPATLSAGVLFTHIRYPLGQAIEEARRLLDDVAKDGNGRDSLAAAVLKPGGLHCEWTTTWNRPSRVSGEKGKIGATEQLNRVIRHLRTMKDEPGISSGLLYRIRDTLSLLCGLDSWKPGTWASPPEELDLADFVRAEVFQSLSKQEGEDRGRADELTKLVCDLLYRSKGGNGESAADARLPSPGVCDLLYRSKGGNGRPSTPEIGLDGLLLARFLASPREE